MSEYWIQQDGSVEFADGDIGDYNHESIVVDSVQREIIDKCRSKYGNRLKGYFDNDWNKFTEALVKAYSLIFYKNRPLFTKSWVKHQTTYDPQSFEWPAAKFAGVKKHEWDCAIGLGDARDYAMLYWGWKTYRNGNIDTWRFTRADLQAIVNGLGEIAEQEGWSDKKLNRSSFSINVFSNKKHFSLSFMQMEKWLQKPQEVPPIANQDQTFGDEFSKARDMSIRNMEIEKMNPVYKRPGVHPFGDSVLYPFHTFVEIRDKMNEEYGDINTFSNPGQALFNDEKFRSKGIKSKFLQGGEKEDPPLPKSPEKLFGKRPIKNSSKPLPRA